MIYLDHAAATTPFGDLLASDIPTANPSSAHSAGRQARARIDQARRQVAGLLEAKTAEVIFTSGATEAIHLAVIGGWLGRQQANRGVVYLSPLVHSCVWAAVGFLEKHFSVEVRHLPLTPAGFIDVEACDEVGEGDLVIVEHGNSETGHLQPVAKLGKKLIKLATETGQIKPTLIVDAAASVVTEKVALEYQKADFTAISAEKFGGLAGTGVLLYRQGTPLSPLQGGSHEWGIRGGTENLVGITALAKALQVHSEQRTKSRERYLGYQQQCRDFFAKELPDCVITTPETDSLPHVFHFCLPDEKAALFVARADQAGLCISAGSACSSGTTTASKTLLYLGLTESEAERGVRLSFGRTTTSEEVGEALVTVKQLLS